MPPPGGDRTPHARCLTPVGGPLNGWVLHPLARSGVSRYVWGSVSWTFVLRPSETESFDSCRRAWDLGARVRRDLVPRIPRRSTSMPPIHAGLAVYYFPAMDDWSRSIVRPLALEGFRRAMREDRAAYERRSQRSTPGSRTTSHGGPGSAICCCIASSRSRPRSTTSTRCWRRTTSGRPCPTRIIRDRSSARATADRSATSAVSISSSPTPTTSGGSSTTACRGDDGPPTTSCSGELRTVRTLWALETAYPQIHVAGTVHNELLITAGCRRRCRSASAWTSTSSIDVTCRARDA